MNLQIIESILMQRQKLLNSIRFIELGILEINDSEYADICSNLIRIQEKLQEDVEEWNKKLKEEV